MAKKNSTKRHLDQLFEAMKPVRAKLETEGEKPSKEEKLLFALGLAKAVNTAFEEVFEATKAARAKSESEGEKPSKEEKLLFAVRLAKPMYTAFEQAGLDIENAEDWIRLTIYFSAAVYGKGPGQAPTWSHQEYERLLKDIAEIESANPDDNELESCKKLIRKNQGTYNEVREASTLRRVLQDAKQMKNIRKRFSNLANKGRGPFDVLKTEKKLRSR